MATMFDLLNSQQLAAYWTEMKQDEAPYPGEELFPDNKKMGLRLSWIKGSKGLPVVLKQSAFDTTAVPRQRLGFDKMSADMPFFKESMYIDEETRQELNLVLETGNQAYIDSVLNKVFDDENTLLRGAAAAREMMRMMALTTGYVTLSLGRDTTYTYDYGVQHKGNAQTSWSDIENADPIEDIRNAQEEVLNDTGVKPTRAMCNNSVWRYLRNNVKIRKAIYVLSDGQGTVSDNQLKTYLKDTLDIDVYVNDKRYKVNTYETSAGANTMKYVDDDIFVLFPEGTLGTTWFGTTPSESDLMTGSAANVSIVDTGVAVTAVQRVDPVQVETIVSQICLPSFEAADTVYIMDVAGA